MSNKLYSTKPISVDSNPELTNKYKEILRHEKMNVYALFVKEQLNNPLESLITIFKALDRSLHILIEFYFKKPLRKKNNSKILLDYGVKCLRRKKS